MKQVIVIRKDLNMRKGKMCAMASHASMKVFFDRGQVLKHRQPGEEWDSMLVNVTGMTDWIEGSFAKIVCGCDSEEELIALYNAAKSVDLPCSLITDAGRTEFHGVPTKTAIAIGPAKSKRIDPVTGHLKLL